MKLGLVSLGALAFTRKPFLVRRALPDFPQGSRLGRVFHLAEVKAKPNQDSSTIKTLYQDDVVDWQKDVIGEAPSTYSTNRRWVETVDGYVPAIDLQPVKAILNTPLASLPQQTSDVGMWAEITVPYVDVTLDAPAKTPLIEGQTQTRFYYSQVFWVDGIKQGDSGNTLYHFLEKHGSYGDSFWADARAFKPITADELSPINPQVADKKIIVDLTHQILSCYEGNREVMYSRVSTGALDLQGNYVDKWATPIGDYHVVNRKFITIHMAGGSAASGYELFSVCWTSIFATNGVAMHSTYWHNNFGERMSHGCINLPPEDAKFIYRWTKPEVPYDEGKIEQAGYEGTTVQVKEEPF
jgi:lipoprotein-anchoring transpeptidase ErfK/SrfK